jgi:hypothetical protein
MDRQTLRDWAHRFNAKGPEGLINGKAPGPGNYWPKEATVDDHHRTSQRGQPPKTGW